MLTPYVTGLVFANCITATCLAAVLGALTIADSDRVLFGKWSGTEVKIDGEDLLIMKESDVLGIVEETSKLRKAA